MKKTNTFYLTLFLLHAAVYFTDFYLIYSMVWGYSRSYLLSRPFTWFCILWGLWILLNLFFLLVLIRRKKHHCGFFILEILFTSISFGLLLVSLILYDFASVSIVGS